MLRQLILPFVSVRISGANQCTISDGNINLYSPNSTKSLKKITATEAISVVILKRLTVQMLFKLYSKPKLTKYVLVRVSSLDTTM